MIASAKRYMTAIAAAALIAVAVSACGGGGGGNGPTPTQPQPQPQPTDVDLSRVTSGFMANAGTVTIEAGQSTDHGDIQFGCATGGADCEVMVMVDTGGVIRPHRPGTVTAMNAPGYPRGTVNVDLSNVTVGFLAMQHDAWIKAGESKNHGDLGWPDTVMVMVAQNGTIRSPAAT